MAEAYRRTRLKLFAGTPTLRTRVTRPLNTASASCITTVKECRRITPRRSDGTPKPQNGVTWKRSFNWGKCTINGRGVLQDYAEAVRWYRKAADQGYAIAQYDLGNMYDQGKGVPQNYGEVRRWYRKAADQGYTNSQRALSALDRQQRREYETAPLR